MNTRLIFRPLIALGLCLGLVSFFVPAASFAASLASDKASDPVYSGGWTNGSNGGVGWGTNSWQLFVADVQTNVPAATFISSSTNNNAAGDTNVVGDIDTAGVAWGTLGAGPAGTQDVGAIRFFNGSLTNGQRFVVYMDNGFVPPGEFAGFFLHNTNLDTRLQFLATNQTYVLQGVETGITATNTGIANTDEGLKIEVQVVNVDTVNVFVTKLVTGTQSVFSNIALGAVGAHTHDIQGVSLINNGAGAGATNRVFFNSMQILPNPADTNLFADLAVNKTVSPDPAIAGSSLTYTVTVTNNGPADATAVTVTDVPPAGIAFVTAPSQGTCTNIGGRIICDLGILTNTGIASITLVGTPPSTGAITNTAVVTALNVDPNPTNNVVTNSVSVIAAGALSVSPANQDFGSVATGTTVQTTFVVTNAGGTSLVGSAVVAVAQFVISDGTPFSIPAFGTTNVVVDFTPDSVGAFTDNVIFASNGGDSTNQITGSGAIAVLADFTGTPTNGAAPLAVDFTDASAGTITNQLWDFGDGDTSASVSPSHTYTNTGTFSVSLTVFGPLGTDTLTRSSYISVTSTGAVAPSAAFTGTPTSGAAPLTVDFTDGSSGTITNRLWTFGDGGTTNTASPSHTYANAGTFSVGLTVFGPLGTDTVTRSSYIAVTSTSAVAPVAAFTASPTNGPAVLIVSFTDHSTGTITNRLWNFGDGNVQVGGLTATHVYSNSATVSLTVFGPGGLNTATNHIGVSGIAKNSPLGDFEIKVSGADKGIGFVTFSNNATATGYEIRMKTFGLDTLSGTWGLDAKGKLTGAFVEKLRSTTNWTGTLAGTAKTDKSFSGKVTAIPAGFFSWKGIPATTLPDLSGTWSGQVTIAKAAGSNVAYKITMNATNAGVFDVASATATNTVLGQFIVTSKDAVAGWLQISTNETTLAGKGKLTGPKAPTITLKGTDDSADKIGLKLIKE